METKPDQPDDFVSLYRSAFKDFGSRALWNVRELEDPRPEDALVIARHLRVEGNLAARRLAERIERYAMPLNRLQSQILRLLASHRNPESYVAGSTPLNLCKGWVALPGSPVSRNPSNLHVSQKDAHPVSEYPCKDFKHKLNCQIRMMGGSQLSPCTYRPDLPCLVVVQRPIPRPGVS